MRRDLLPALIITVIVSVLSGCASARYSKAVSANLDNDIKLLLDNSPVLNGSLIYNPDIIIRMYESGGGLISARWDSWYKIAQMTSAIRNVSRDGLRPDDYHYSEIEDITEKLFASDDTSPEDIARLELLLTDAFLVLSTHLAAGKTDPVTIDPQWNASRRMVTQNWERFIDSVLMTGSIIETIHSLSPRHREYYNLKKGLAAYRNLEAAGGWEGFTTSLLKLEKGMRHQDVVLLRKRLDVTEGKNKTDTIDFDLFDQALYDQVVRFQRKNGLNPDGVVGKGTIEALNIPVEDRIATIEANLERWRWINDDLGQRYIKVNIAGFELQVIESGQQVFSSQAVVGRLYRETPVFSSKMRSIVLNPYWTVPETILKEDIAPAVLKDTGYLARKKMKILRSDGTEVNPSAVDWNKVITNGFPYIIRQEPGPGNSLGRVKFLFPNKYDVYIHDSPVRSMFLQNIRTFSSGCIRISKPLELVQFLLEDDPDWGPDRIKEVLASGMEQTIILRDPMPVHILYLTAWADDDGTVYFGRDVYNRDPQLIKALNEVPPQTGQ